MNCPCCGTEINRVPTISGLSEVPLPKLQRRILAALIERYPAAVSSTRLADVCYFDDPTGGPLNASNSISVTISRTLRPRLRGLGWGIGAKEHTGIQLWPLTDAEMARVPAE